MDVVLQVGNYIWPQHGQVQCIVSGASTSGQTGNIFMAGAGAGAGAGYGAWLLGRGGCGVGGCVCLFTHNEY